MNSPIEKIFKDAGNLALTRDEKNAMRTHILAFMNAHPAVPRPRLSWSALRDVFSLDRTPRRMAPLLAAMLILFLGTGGIAAASRSSLPGELLYPVKIEVAERVEGLLYASSAQKARWQTELVGRRLEEAETLVAEERWGEKTRTVVEANLEKHSEKARAYIRELEAAGRSDSAEEESGQLEVTLETHGKIFAALAEKQKQASLQTHPFLKELEKHADTAATVRTELEEKIFASGSPKPQSPIEQKIDAAKKELVATRILVKEKRGGLKAESRASAEAKISAAEESFQKGKKALDEGRLKDAFRESRQAARAAEEAKLILKADENLRIGITIDETPTTSILAVPEAMEKGEKESTSSPLLPKTPLLEEK